MTIVSPYFTFPAISWWAGVVKAETVLFDAAEHFQKMTWRNKYHVSGANNSNKLSVPLVNGRNQRVPMREVNIHNESRWQTQHWRTVVSVYRRTPYFEYYESSLQPLFEKQFTSLIDYNKATIQWAKKQLRLQFEEQETDTFIKNYPPDVVDLRFPKSTQLAFPRYYQVFEDRIGFLPDLSILDLLFSEGPRARDYLLTVNESLLRP